MEAAGVYAGSTTAYVHPANPTVPPFANEDTPLGGLYAKHQTEGRPDDAGFYGATGLEAGA